MNNRSIGIFDSGLGGLTVLRRLSSLLPYENLVYFGDTGRVPYGTRSPKTIDRYAKEDTGFLLSKNVKLIIAACGTVSSVAPHAALNLPVPYIGVVEPAAAKAVKATVSGRIGVIGTPATIKSGAYDRHIKFLSPNAEIFSKDCPLFVPLVENGWISPNDPIPAAVVERYLSHLREKNIDTLILGCTHFPLLSEFIGEYMGSEVTLIDAGFEAACAAKDLLIAQNLLTHRETPGKSNFYVSDETEGFSKIASLFLGRELEGNVHHIEI